MEEKREEGAIEKLTEKEGEEVEGERNKKAIMATLSPICIWL